MPAPTSERVIFALLNAVSAGRVELEITSRCWKDCEVSLEGKED